LTRAMRAPMSYCASTCLTPSTHASLAPPGRTYEGASRAPKAQTATAKCSATATGMEWMSSAASFAL